MISIISRGLSSGPKTTNPTTYLMLTHDSHHRRADLVGLVDRTD